jgi:hypothetical protein
MKTSGAALEQLVINHPRIPHKVVPASPVLNGDPICIVELTGGFFRVLHIDSGITLTDTRTLAAALRFTSAIRDKYINEPIFRRKLDEASWERFCHQSGGSDPNCVWLVLALNSLNSMEDNVSKSVTHNERYLHPPEPIL